MKKKYLLLGCMTLALTLISCKSTPKDEPTDVTPVQEETQTEETVEPVDNSADMAALLANTELARNKAFEAGAQDSYSDAFAKADKDYEALKLGNDADAVKDLTARYAALETACKAKKLKDRIENLNLAPNGSADYDKGNEAMSAFDTLINDDSATGKALLDKATEAYNSYYAVCYASFKAMADDERKAAVEQKKLADSVKAGVARKEDYKKAADLINSGDSCYVTKDPEGAFNRYQESKISFTTLYSDVSEKRAAAQKAIDDAKKKVQEANEYAAATDETNPLGDEKVEGIEDENAVLLEEDKFENPEDAVIKVEDEDLLKEKAGSK